MKFYKYHGLGNDYLVMNRSESDKDLTPELISKICHRNYGIGADGILECQVDPEGEIFAHIYNSDGSEAEISGNGIRILSYSLVEKAWTRRTEFEIETPFKKVFAKVDLHNKMVSVDMGIPDFSAKTIPVNVDAREPLRVKGKIGGNEMEFSCVSMGNPHCVIIREDEVTPELAKEIGPIAEKSPLFPNKTNVQFVNVVSKNRIKIEIWERGSGYTLASGSSSCAAASVCHKLGLCGDDITVSMPGGDIFIEFSGNGSVIMTGPVEKVAEGVLFL